jgi:hypothetical protein
VLGHEAGHILSDHVLYRTALIILLNISGIGRMPILMGLPLVAVRLALLEWFRAAELSCDRAATLVNRDPLVTCRTLMVIAGGAASRRLNLDAFMRQAGEYRDSEWGFDRIARLRLELAPTHPIPVKRVHEVMDWVRSGEYDRIVDGAYMRRGEEPPARDDAGDAVDFYTERFRRFFKEAGAGVASAGDKLSDAASKVSDWIRTGKDS